MIEHHGLFQGLYFFHHLGLDRHVRERHLGHPHYERTAAFCELYDAPAFDASAETLPLEVFEPLLRRVMGTVRTSIYAR